MRRVVDDTKLYRLGNLFLLSEIRGACKGIAQLLELLVAGPAKPGAIARGIDLRVDQGICQIQPGTCDQQRTPANRWRFLPNPTPYHPRPPPPLHPNLPPHPL